MRLRTILAGAAGAAGVTTLANRVLSARASGFEPFLDGEHRTYRWNGFDVAYTETGDPGDPDLLLLHGISAAASSHEWAPVIELLAEDHHVLAPDLPGFGHSDRPPLLYSAGTYESFVADAIADLTDDPPVVVASSLSSAYAAVAAETEPVAELVLVSPTTDTLGSRSVPLRTLLRTPLVGQGLFNCIVSKPAIRYFQADHGYYDVENYDEAALRYEWLTAHQAGARYAPASFVTGFLDPDVDLGATLADLDAPVSLAWGRAADITPLERGRELAERADASLVVFDEARLLPHVEHPASFSTLVQSGPEAVEESAG